jgi:Flp pilus assembly pilin Flp
MFQAVKKLWHDEEGLSTFEYALLLVLIVILGITAWQSTGHAVPSRVTSVENSIVSAG